MVKRSIAQLREKAPYILKRNGRAKQKMKLLKAYHGKRLKELWAARSKFEEVFTIAECKNFEGVGHRMKGGHRHNHIYNVCNRITFRGKKSRRVRPADKKYFVSIFWENIALMPDELNKILANKRKRKWQI